MRKIPSDSNITEEVYDKLKQFFEPFNQMVSANDSCMTSRLKSTTHQKNFTYTTNVLHVSVQFYQLIYRDMGWAARTWEDMHV